MAFDQGIQLDLIESEVDGIFLPDELHFDTSHPRNGRYLECLKDAKFSKGKQHYANQVLF